MGRSHNDISIWNNSNLHYIFSLNLLSPHPPQKMRRISMDEPTPETLSRKDNARLVLEFIVGTLPRWQAASEASAPEPGRSEDEARCSGLIVVSQKGPLAAREGRDSSNRRNQNRQCSARRPAGGFKNGLLTTLPAWRGR